MSSLLASASGPAVRHLADSVPSDNAVVAGGTGALVFILLILAVGLICRSLVQRLKNVERAEEEGLYGPSTKKDQHQIIPGSTRSRTGLRAPKPPVQP